MNAGMKKIGSVIVTSVKVVGCVLAFIAASATKREPQKLHLKGPVRMLSDRELEDIANKALCGDVILSTNQLTAMKSELHQRGKTQKDNSKRKLARELKRKLG